MKIHQQRWLMLPLSFMMATVILSGCGNSYGGSSNSTQSTAAESGKAEVKYTVMVSKNDKLGRYLVDAKGMTLYYYTKDAPGTSNCSGGCLEVWPAFHADSIQVQDGLAASDFGEITRKDGSKQTTFKGYPLYYYVKDKQPGDVTGQDVNDVWYVVPPDSFHGSSTEEDHDKYSKSY